MNKATKIVKDIIGKNNNYGASPGSQYSFSWPEDTRKAEVDAYSIPPYEKKKKKIGGQ